MGDELNITTSEESQFNLWDYRFLMMAKMVGTWSKDPSKKIGAVAIDDKKHILSTGYNGFPKGIADTEERLNDRPTKYKYVVHGEMNAIYNATYNGINLDGSTLYVWGLPVCSECAKGIVQVGIKRVVIGYEDLPEERWVESFNSTLEIFNEAGVVVEDYHLTHNT
jgi:dCMP deaminase